MCRYGELSSGINPYWAWLIITQNTNWTNATYISWYGWLRKLHLLLVQVKDNNLLFLSEKGYCMRGDLCSWDHGADPLVLEDAALSRVMLPAHVPGKISCFTITEISVTFIRLKQCDAPRERIHDLNQSCPFLSCQICARKGSQVWACKFSCSLY